MGIEIFTTGFISGAISVAVLVGLAKLAQAIRERQDKKASRKGFKEGEVVVKLESAQDRHAQLSVHIIHSAAGKSSCIMSPEWLAIGDGVRLSDIKFGSNKEGMA